MRNKKLIEVKDVLKKKIEVPYIGFVAFCSAVLTILFISVTFIIVGYSGYLPKNQIIELVNKLENEYIYDEVFDKEEYKLLKHNLFNKKRYAKQDFEEFLNETKKLANDKYSYFYFDDYIGKSIIKGYTIANKSEDNFKYDIDDNNLGYIYFTSFENGTSKMFIDALEYFNQNEVKELIIDLRENNGGISAELINIADALLPEVQIYNTRFRQKNIITYSDESYMKFDKIFVFLSNESASCAEILPLTLKENLGDKVILIGNETHKKSVGQSTLNKANYRFEYYVVSHRWFVNDKDVNDLNDYLKLYDKEFKPEDIQTYLDVVYENL